MREEWGEEQDRDGTNPNLIGTPWSFSVDLGGGGRRLKTGEIWRKGGEAEAC